MAKRLWGLPAIIREPKTLFLIWCMNYYGITIGYSREQSPKIKMRTPNLYLILYNDNCRSSVLCIINQMRSTSTCLQIQHSPSWYCFRLFCCKRIINSVRTEANYVYFPPSWGVTMVWRTYIWQWTLISIHPHRHVPPRSHTNQELPPSFLD